MPEENPSCMKQISQSPAWSGILRNDRAWGSIMESERGGSAARSLLFRSPPHRTTTLSPRRSLRLRGLFYFNNCHINDLLISSSASEKSNFRSSMPQLLPLRFPLCGSGTRNNFFGEVLISGASQAGWANSYCIPNRKAGLSSQYQPGLDSGTSKNKYEKIPARALHPDRIIKPNCL